MAGLQSFAAGVVIEVFTNDKVQEVLKGLLNDLVTEKVLPLFPLLSATAATAISAEFKKKFNEVLESDPDIPVVSDVFDLSELIRTTLNGHPEVNIPFLGNVLKGFGGK